MVSVMEGQTLNQTQTKGQELYAAGDFQGAMEQYRQWTATMPTSPDAWRMLGFAQYACQLFTDSVTSMGRAVGLQPENPENNFGLGMANAATSDFDSAISSFDETVRLRPDHPHAKKGLVDALLRRAEAGGRSSATPRQSRERNGRDARREALRRGFEVVVPT